MLCQADNHPTIPSGTPLRGSEEDNAFILTTCAVGSQAVLGRWLLEQRGWRSAFSRPVLVSYWVEKPVETDFAGPHPLIRTWGLSLGFCSSAPDLECALEISGRPVLQVLKI